MEEWARERFIPAGAGNTTRSVPTSRVAPVHPRWRGEHRRQAARGVVAHGSSPLARGTLEGAVDACHVGRFIPAGAGNTRLFTVTFCALPVHPRWRGEHMIITGLAALFGGSSPLARGTHLADSDLCFVPRFIPAGAGNTRCRRCRRP